MTVIRQAVSDLLEIFRKAPHKRAAHAESRPLLQQLSREPAFLSEALRQYVGQRANLERGNYPVLAIRIASNAYFDLVINCWIPLPSGGTDLSTKAIHHHGTLLLSTATIFGPGYEHWLFTRARPLQDSTTLYDMSLLETSRHGPQHVAFVDAFVPHLPMYPPSLSLTLALWSDSRPTTVVDRAKRMPLVRGREAQLRRLALRLGLRKALSLKVAESFDFHPVPGGFEVIADRREFPLGPNEDHLQSLFHVLQRTGNEEIAAEIARHRAGGPLARQRVVDDLLARLRRGETVEGKLSPGHTDVPYANFTSREIVNSLRALPKAQPASRKLHAS
jgi:hypothetical protein